MTCEFVGSFFGLNQLPKDRRLQIALAGRSNVGKSTLLNKIVGRKNIAKVSATPGKTRSLNFFLANNRFYLVDLPGYGYAKVSKAERKDWGKLIESYLKKGPDLAGLVLLLDCRRDPTDDDLELMDWLGHRQIPVLTVVTKADKLTRDKMNRKLAAVESELGVSAVGFSAVSGLGKKELVDAILGFVEETSNI